MSITERLLTQAGGNKSKAGAELTKGLMRGDPDTFKQGYSLASALMATIEQYNLSPREVALVAEHVVDTTTEQNSPTRQPLVIVHVGGGMVQWTHEKQGLGTPRVMILDFDKEGAEEAELRTFLGEIDEALEALGAYNDPTDHDALYNLGLARNEYQDHIDEGTQPSRFR